jgi:hypothetical protein
MVLALKHIVTVKNSYFLCENEHIYPFLLLLYQNKTMFYYKNSEFEIKLKDLDKNVAYLKPVYL